MKKLTIRQIYDLNNKFLLDIFLPTGIKITQNYCQYQGQKAIRFNFILTNSHTIKYEGVERICSTQINHTFHRSYTELLTKEEVINLAEITVGKYSKTSSLRLQAIIDKMKQA